jgi:hypothetical protein
MAEIRIFTRTAGISRRCSRHRASCTGLGESNVRFAVHIGPDSDIAPCPFGCQKRTHDGAARII